MKSVTILGETVSKKNGKTWNGYQKRLINSDRYQAWHSSAMEQLMVQKKGFYTDNCKIIFTFYHKDRLRRDSDNAVSSLFDTLKDAGYIKDDNWEVIQKHLVFNKMDYTPRVVIDIYEVGEYPSVIF